MRRRLPNRVRPNLEQDALRRDRGRRRTRAAHWLCGACAGSSQSRPICLRSRPKSCVTVAETSVASDHCRLLQSPALAPKFGSGGAVPPGGRSAGGAALWGADRSIDRGSVDEPKLRLSAAPAGIRRSDDGVGAPTNGSLTNPPMEISSPAGAAIQCGSAAGAYGSLSAVQRPSYRGKARQGSHWPG
jgi:hypothetical protein